VVRAPDVTLSGHNFISQWSSLLKDACRLIEHVNRDFPILTHWSLGGGTALMLQIDHRESFDIDLFIDDPQLLGYLYASVKQVKFEGGLPAVSGDGSIHLRLAFLNSGEIDFIVAGSLTTYPTVKTNVGNQHIELETVAEIIAKKVRYRGSNIQARDVFDIAAACQAGHLTEIKNALATIPEYRDKTKQKLQTLSADYINTTISQLMIKPKFETLKLTSADIALEALSPN
jgi:Nucleotidyl transferase AbiEii toxin, Type IV TA system